MQLTVEDLTSTSTHLLLMHMVISHTQHSAPCPKSPHQQGQELCVTQLVSTISQGLLVLEALCDSQDLKCLQGQTPVWHLLNRELLLHLKETSKYFLRGKSTHLQKHKTLTHFKLTAPASINTQAPTSSFKRPHST